jgi:hypothetical protein
MRFAGTPRSGGKNAKTPAAPPAKTERFAESSSTSAASILFYQPIALCAEGLVSEIALDLQ